jgi:hypothetical protein
MERFCLRMRSSNPIDRDDYPPDGTNLRPASTGPRHPPGSSVRPVHFALTTGRRGLLARGVTTR